METAFRRLMAWVGMGCALRGAPWACTAVEVESGKGSQRVRVKAWPLTPLGKVINLDKIIGRG